MENAVEALKTAAAVLVFVIAITVSFTMFSKAKTTADSIITMQDKQEYLEADELVGEQYESSTKSITGMNANGDRIVNLEDIVSAIYRYNLEKYGVTIIEKTGDTGKVLARFDSNTESIMRQWYNIQEKKDEETGSILSKVDIQNNIRDQIRKNLTTTYIKEFEDITLDLTEIYKIEVDGNSTIKVGAPWYGNEKEIIKRCNADISGEDYIYGTAGSAGNITYKGKKLWEKLNVKANNRKITEVIKEIDQSKYIGETNLLQEYQLPTIEVIYIVE